MNVHVLENHQRFNCFSLSATFYFWCPETDVHKFMAYYDIHSPSIILTPLKLIFWYCGLFCPNFYYKYKYIYLILFNFNYNFQQLYKIIIISVRSYFIRRKLHHKWIIRYCYTYLYSFMCMGALWYMVYGIYIIYKLDIIIYNKYIITIYIISVYHVHA